MQNQSYKDWAMLNNTDRSVMYKYMGGPLVCLVLIGALVIICDLYVIEIMLIIFLRMLMQLRKFPQH
jgi:hypothetical protein